MNLDKYERLLIRNAFVEIAKSFLNVPYKFGGKTPMDGMDCSQLVVEALRQIGYIGWDEDLTANDIWHRFSVRYPNSIVPPGPGSLAFWFQDGIAEHCAICIDRVMTIQASGGGPEVKTLDEAVRRRAYVMYKRVDIDKRNCRFIDIFPETRGM